MSDKSEQILSQVQALWRGALGQVGHQAGLVARQVSVRLERERQRPKKGWLDRAIRTSARLAEGEVLPLPSGVKKTLRRIYNVLETRVATQGSSHAATEARGRTRAPSQAKPKIVQAKPTADAQGQDGEAQQVKAPRKRRARRREKSVEF